jgi:hypothetical protein
VIDYFLKTKPPAEEKLTLEILDAQGKVLRTLSNHKKEKFEQPAEWPDREPPADLLPDAAGMNRFAWDLRVEDPQQIPGAFYADEGPRGPVVTPGAYLVRLTTRSAVQSVPLQVVLDPRLKDTVTAGDMTAHWDLVTRTTQDIDALHRAVNQMRTIRRNLETLKAWVGSDAAGKTLVAAAADFDKHMAPIEEELIQVNMKASEDNLRYPNRLNEQYDTFIATVDTDDLAPTVAQQEVYADLHRRLVEQLEKWKSLANKELPALNTRMQEAGIPRLAVGEGD